MTNITKNNNEFQITKSVNHNNESDLILWYAGPSKPHFLGFYKNIDDANEKINSYQ